ncbi:hypothetical protein [Streptomyces sp. NPDC056987]|uniref:hypothetical protein n=1 Tax=Streptomyces sp. NPDC056987 TaxID=3345988 RepID=UPI00363FE6E7
MACLLGGGDRVPGQRHRAPDVHMERGAPYGRGQQHRRRVNLNPLLQALDLQEDAARTLADELRTRIDALQNQLRDGELRLEHLAITRTTITGLADGIPDQAADLAGSLELPEHPDYPRILAVFNDTSGPLRARDICQALDFELLLKHVERTRNKMKRLVTLGILSEAEPGTFSKKQ